VAEAGATQEQHVAVAAQAQAQVDGVVAELQARALRLRERQASALSVTGEESSRDGSVRAVVDATGVVTSLEFAPSVFDRNTPDKLARTVVATIQAAATKARAQMSEAWQASDEQDSGVLTAAARGTAQFGVLKLGVPEVPRTESDPTGRQDSWRQRPAEQPEGDGLDNDERPWADERPWK
jgi:DNA-binding protein YbaB